MCLTEVTKIHKRGQHKTGKGYKFFDVRDGLLFPAFRGYRPLLEGRWLNEKDYRPDYAEKAGTEKPLITVLKDDKERKYPLGWHIYVKHDPLSGIGFVFRQVLYRDILAVGTQGSWKTIVAREILIVPEGGETKKEWLGRGKNEKD